MRRSGNAAVTVQELRSELERFAQETLQRELTALREHVDQALGRGSQLAAAARTSPREAPAPPPPSAPPCRADSVELQSLDGFAPGSEAPGHPFTRANSQESGMAAASAPQRRFRSTMVDRPLNSEVKWATRRTGFVSPAAEEQAGFGRRRNSGGRGAQESRESPPMRLLPCGAAEESAFPPIKEECDSDTASPGASARLLHHANGAETLGGIPAQPLGDRGDDEEAEALADCGGSREMGLAPGETASRESLFSRLRDGAELVLLSESFDYAIAGLILMNAIVIGIETEYMASHWCTEAPASFRSLDRLFCLVFLAEISLRLCTGGAGFFSEQGWKWNIFDLLVVLMQLLDEAIRALALSRGDARGLQGLSSNELSTMRILRLFRLVRLLRLTRVLRLLGGLRMLVVSIVDSLRSLAWTLTLLFVMTFVFGVFLTQLVTDHKVLHSDEKEREDMEDLLYRFGSLDRSMLCLYEAISEGVHWADVLRPLMEHCGRWLALAFIVYMSFTLFAIMNVVTGVFCESAIRTAEEDKRHVLVQQMHQLFCEADDDGSGTISAEEFEAHLKDPQMLMYLKAIDVNPDEARHLFSLLDGEDAGEIEAMALVNGCLRLQGSAKAIELAAFMQEHRIGFERLMDHADLVERSLAYLCETAGTRPAE